MDFKECPSYPGYAASICGVIKRLEWSSITKLGKMRINAERILERIGRDKRYVLVDNKFKVPAALVYDAWYRDCDVEPVALDRDNKLGGDPWAGWCHRNDYRVRKLKRPPVPGF